MQQVKTELEMLMNKAIQTLHKQISRVRTGRASASILDDILVDYYGTPTPVAQVGQISTPEARLLQIQPFDKSSITNIEKAIINANLGVNPSNDGNLIRIPFPALTEDKRRSLVKEVKKIGEDAKISVRKVRREQNDYVKSEEKTKNISEDDAKKIQKEIQEITDEFINKIEDIINAKEKELLTV